MTQRFLTALTLALLTATGCGAIPLGPTPTPLPGWDQPVARLLMGMTELPVGWQIEPEEDDMLNAARNHVWQTLYDGRADHWGKIIQDIWRGPTQEQADAKFEELAQRLNARGWLPRYPSTVFQHPADIDYAGKVADRWGLACGVDEVAECNFLGQYQNYVTWVYLALDYGELDRLDFATLEPFLESIDEQFARSLGIAEKASATPATNAAAPATPGVDAEITLKSLLIEAGALPAGWDLLLPEWEVVKQFTTGDWVLTRNFGKPDCYADTTKLSFCEVTEFVAQYPNTQRAMEEVERARTIVTIELAGGLGQTTIPADIAWADVKAEEVVITCIALAGGESCTAHLRYGPNLIAVAADMAAEVTFLGTARFGLTHAEFEHLLASVDQQAGSALSP